MDCGTCEVVTITEAPEPIDVKITVTDSAAEMLQEAFGEDQNSALLVGVLSGGCSGYMYDLQIIEGAYPDCQELNERGFKILVPNAASHLLNGIEIDYENKLMGGGFKINNPNAQSACGCGESFS